MPVDPLDTSEFAQSQQTQAPKRLSADPVPVAADPHLGFRFLDSSQVAPAPDLEEPTSGVLEQLSFVESQEEWPLVHLPPQIQFNEFHAKRALGLSQVPLLLSICGQPVFGASFFAIMGSVSSLFQV